ncbi:MAG: DUF308 domain-containing protein [Ignavibacteria bacterium]|nr:DUF308 domain-containing protein [Ignavibacteria bacterium]
MLNTMLKKWWIILIQGILLFILGVLIFRNPVEVLTGISLWFGIILLVTGAIGLFGWLFSGSEDRDLWILIWSILTAVFGILLLSNILAAMKVITVIFGIWILITGFKLTSSGWSLRKENSLGWFLLIVGVLSIAAGIIMIFNISSGAAGIAVILGIQVILSGIALILLAFVKRSLTGKIEDQIKKMRSI